MPLPFLVMEDCDLNHQRVMIRLDLNVPMKEGMILNDAKIRASLPTIELLIKKNAKILLLSHLGRPKEGVYEHEFSLKPIAAHLEKLLGQKIFFEKDWLNNPFQDSDIVLGENVRFNQGEESNDLNLSQRMASLCDVFVMDAFASAHRAHASTVGVAEFAKKAVAGPLLKAEIQALNDALVTPKKPLVAIVAGAKVSDKLRLLRSLLDKVQILIVGGGIANTFIAAQGFSIGASLYEKELLETAQELLAYAKIKGVKLITPHDGIVANDLSSDARITDLTDIKADEKIFDAGPNSLLEYQAILQNAGTILWNGPLGVFEVDLFGNGTKSLAKAIAQSKAFSIAGGGETLAAIEKYDVSNNMSYISTGGGAFLEYLEGKKLPAIAMLEKRAKEVSP